MNEQFDQDLSRVLKEGDGTLRGLEFTPQMRSYVMERIRAEESGIAPARKPFAIPRPLAWAAALAAALVIAVNTDLWKVGGFGSAQKESAPQQPAAMSAASAPAESSAKLAAPAAPAPMPATPSAQSAQPEQRFSMSAADAQSSPGGARQESLPSQAPVHVNLTLSAELKDASGPAAKAEAPPALTGAPAADAPVALAFSLANGQAVQLDLRRVKAVNQAGAVIWERRLEGITANSLLSVSADGRIAVAAGVRVHLLGPDGALERTLSLPATVTGVSRASTGAVAVTHGSVVAGYLDGRKLYEISDLEAPRAALSDGGDLAVLGRSGGVLKLRRYSDPGALAWERNVPESTEALAFAGESGVLLAGRTAYDARGNTLWNVSYWPRGVAAMGRQDLVAWTNDMAWGLRAADGGELWIASMTGPGRNLIRVVPAADGSKAAVLGSRDSTGMFWVITREGAQILSGTLPEHPVSAAFVGERLLVLTGSGLTVRELPR